MFKFLIILAVLLVASTSVGAALVGSNYGIWIGEVYYICTYVTPIQVVCLPG